MCAETAASAGHQQPTMLADRFRHRSAAAGHLTLLLRLAAAAAADAVAALTFYIDTHCREVQRPQPLLAYWDAAGREGMKSCIVGR